MDTVPRQPVQEWEAARRAPPGGEPAGPGATPAVADGPPAAGAWPDDGPSELPSGYGVDRLTLLVRDPRCVFAFWEVTEGGWRDAASRLPPGNGDPELVLRVFDLTDVLGPGSVIGPAPPGDYLAARINELASGGRCFDYAVAGADRWYVHLPEPGRVLAAEIGARRGAAFAPIARSALVYTPPGAAASWEMELGWSSAAIAGWCFSPTGHTSPGGWPPAVTGESC
ncbi:MAG: hypothetical protein DIU82_05905 [Bacillota bacterium]|nr:MAG: hypothetical protein DIU82_05905 [Bacillota bacterium]